MLTCWFLNLQIWQLLKLAEVKVSGKTKERRFSIKKIGNKNVNIARIKIKKFNKMKFLQITWIVSRGLKTFCRREGIRTNENVDRATRSRRGRRIWKQFNQIWNGIFSLEGVPTFSITVVISQQRFISKAYSVSPPTFFTWSWNIWKIFSWNTFT